jgi:hypothetical protein
MFAAIIRLLPSATTILHQIAPSVIATLIAAGLISGYNRAFSGHLTQPRMAALNEAGAEPAAAPAPTTTVAMTKPPAAPATEYITIVERAGEPERVAEKEPKAEAGKDQTLVKVAAPAPVPAARPAAVAAPAPRPEPRVAERHPNEPRLASVPVVVAPAAAPVTVAPMASPAVAAPSALPPPVMMAPPVAAAPPPMVTVPDRPRPASPTYEAQAEDAPPPRPQGPFGMIVNTLRPSSLFARAREFGERIEAAGNEILPNIRPQ